MEKSGKKVKAVPKFEALSGEYDELLREADTDVSIQLTRQLPPAELLANPEMMTQQPTGPSSGPNVAMMHTLNLTSNPQTGEPPKYALGVHMENGGSLVQGHCDTSGMTTFVMQRRLPFFRNGSYLVQAQAMTGGMAAVVLSADVRQRFSTYSAKMQSAQAPEISVAYTKSLFDHNDPKYNHRVFVGVEGKYDEGTRSSSVRWALSHYNVARKLAFYAEFQRLDTLRLCLLHKFGTTNYFTEFAHAGSGKGGRPGRVTVRTGLETQYADGGSAKIFVDHTLALTGKAVIKLAGRAMLAFNFAWDARSAKFKAGAQLNLAG